MKGNGWIMVTITDNGRKFAGKTIYKDYGSACMIQEILEFQNPYNAYLVYTVEEWEKEQAEG